MASLLFIDGQHGTTGLSILQRLEGRRDLQLIELAPELRRDLSARVDAIARSDIAVLCLPDAAAREIAQATEGVTSCAIIDASTAHRVHGAWTFGFPELTRGQRSTLRESRRISNPGCYSTGAIALLRPLSDEGLLDRSMVHTVLGVSGYSGGGKDLIHLHESVTDIEPFGLYGFDLDHKHLPEIVKYGGLGRTPIFVPSVGHFPQGMLVVIPLSRDHVQAGFERVHQALADRYAGEPLLKVRPFREQEWLSRGRFLRADRLAGRNDMELAVYADAKGERGLLVACLDNLGKGASGAAVQLINIKLGVAETAGLMPNGAT